MIKGDRLSDFIIGFGLLIFAIIIIVFLAYVLIRNRPQNRIWIVDFNGKIYKCADMVEKALKNESPYTGKWVTSVMIVDMEYFPTIDDPAIISLAKSLNDMMAGWTDLDKANFILRFVQQGTEYVLDKDRFKQWDPAGYSERWVFPVDTLKDRCGDCEDTSFLCAGLMHLCGLDTVTISLPGHIAVGVHLEGVELGGMKYEKDGKIYYHAETIENHAIGEFTMDLGTPDFMAYPTVPDDSFRDRIRPKG